MDKGFGKTASSDSCWRYFLCICCLSAVLFLSFTLSCLSIIYFGRKRSVANPFPYEHFITLEQNRMMRFYRFANYFTDVPHLKGSVSRRAWLGFLMRPAHFGQTSPQRYLLRRTLVRTDDIFWLWVRLTALSVLGVVLIPIPIVVYIFTGALAFASSIQLVHALRAGMTSGWTCFSLNRTIRGCLPSATQLAAFELLQSISVLVAGLITIGISVIPVIMAVIVFVVSEATIRGFQ